MYAGAAEAGRTLRFLGTGPARSRRRGLRAGTTLAPHGARPVRSIRAAGRRTSGDGRWRDRARPVPPLRPGADAHLRLSARASANVDDLPRLLTTERGAVRVTEALQAHGSAAPAPVRIGGWFVRDDLGGAVERSLAGHLEAFHAAHPLEEGLPSAGARDAVADALKVAGAPRDPGLIDALLDDLAAARRHRAERRHRPAPRSPGHPRRTQRRRRPAPRRRGRRPRGHARPR